MPSLPTPVPVYVPDSLALVPGFEAPPAGLLLAGAAPARRLHQSIVSATGELLGLLHIEEKESLLVGQWVTYCSPEIVILGMRAALELLAVSPCRAALSDGSAATGDWSDLVPWMQYDMLPQLVGTGVRYAANVRSEDPGGRLAHQEYARHAAQYLTIRLFDDSQTARAWLRQVLAADDAAG